LCARGMWCGAGAQGKGNGIGRQQQREENRCLRVNPHASKWCAQPRAARVVAIPRCRGVRAVPQRGGERRAKQRAGQAVRRRAVLWQCACETGQARWQRAAQRTRGVAGRGGAQESQQWCAKARSRQPRRQAATRAAYGSMARTQKGNQRNGV